MADISRDLNVHGSLLPEAVNMLAGTPAVAQHHNLYNLRPAAAIYNVSVAPILAAFQEVLDAIDDSIKTGKKIDGRLHPNSKKLLDAQSNLLLKITSHVDECYLVLKALQPAVVIKDPHSFTDRWLQQAQHPSIGRFKGAISKYYDYVAKITNRIKHNQARLRYCNFEWGDVVLPGYFVEGVDAAGVLGPDVEIHPTSGAISFPRDLRTHFFTFYLIGNSLSECVKLAVLKQQKVKIKPVAVKSERSEGEKILEIAKRIAGLPGYVFPDELPAGIPEIKTFENESTLQILLTSHCQTKFRYPPNGAGVTASFEGDGHTRSFRFPYLRG